MKFQTQFKQRKDMNALAFYAIALVLLIVVAIWAPAYLAAVLVVLSLIFIVATIRIQIRRYKADSSRNNLYPLAGYISLVFFALALILYRLPELNVVFLRKMTLDYSLAWVIALIASFIGFLLLGLWAWHFIVVRPFLRTYVTFLAIAIFVSSLGALVYTILVFKVIENNNLQLMSQGALTEQVILEDRTNTALFVARTIATDTSFNAAFTGDDYQEVNRLSELFLENSGVDIIRVYNSFGEIIAAPHDVRDKGRMFNEDNLVAFAITNKTQMTSFDTQEGVLAPVIVTRAVYPIISNQNAVGAIEVGYRFDNAFVDFSKKRTGLEVTIYSNDKRSATTIRTLDGVSRWVGSRETDRDTLKAVLDNGESHRTAVDRLGIPYYSAFEPIRNVNGEIIGMVSVGTPTDLLFENTRQQLLTAFLIVTIISLLTALIGYLAIKSFGRAKASS